MPTARTRANRKYNEKAYARPAVTIPKAREQALKAHAEKRGLSVNGLINELLRVDMGLTEEEWRATENTEE